MPPKKGKCEVSKKTKKMEEEEEEVSLAMEIDSDSDVTVDVTIDMDDEEEDENKRTNLKNFLKDVPPVMTDDNEHLFDTDGTYVGEQSGYSSCSSMSSLHE